MEKKFTVEFYETEKGEKPCLEFLNALEIKLRAKAFRDLNLLEEKGTELRLPYSRHLDDGTRNSVFAKSAQKIKNKQ